MPSLADKLKALGVRVGVGDLPPPRPYQTDRVASGGQLEEILGGHQIETPQGETFVVETYFPMEHPLGNRGLGLHAPLHKMATWIGDPSIADLPLPSFAFLDIETTGLSVGAGTYAFLIAIGRFEGDGFHLSQFFMRDPLEEPAHLFAFEEFLAPCQVFVTFNGKSFEVPILNARYISQGWRSPLHDLAHIDLLHPARRLWRERLPKRALIDLEEHILGLRRASDDVPGWMLTQIYFDYLRGDTSLLKNGFYHSAMDVISMVALLDHIASLLNEPFTLGSQFSVDLIALARAYEDLGDLELAKQLYYQSLDHEDVTSQNLPVSMHLEAIQRLASIHKRRESWEAAIHLWEQAAHLRNLEAHLELAKYYEHHLRDYTQALYWTEAAIQLILAPANVAQEEAPDLSHFEKRQWLSELDHRQARLRQKQARST